MVGLVTLLGAGPGDEELLTLKGMRRLKEADVVVFDRLVNPRLLSLVSPKCERIDVGKKPSEPCIKQADIEIILIEKAKEDKRVVRLKSGDPYIFGRGGEEALALTKANVPFEIIPGVTSAIAGATYAGIPMTYRDIATSFHVFTGHLKDETEQLNWEAIGQLKGTLVFLMGMKHLDTIVNALRQQGFLGNTPVAIIEWATHPEQRSIDGTLDTILEEASEQAFSAPSIIVVGDVVRFRKELNFYENRPLFKKNILIQESPTGKLPNLLKDAGAHLITFPSRQKATPKPLSLDAIQKADGLVVTDSKSWTLFLEALRQAKMDIRTLSHLEIMAIGHHTAQTIEDSGVLLKAMTASLEDTYFRKLIEEQKGTWLALAPDYKVAALQSYYQIPVLETHQVAFSYPLPEEDWEQIDLICLPNSLAATNFVAFTKEIDHAWQDHTIVVMGEQTRLVLEQAGFHRVVETTVPTIAAIVETSCSLLGKED